jgi:hypothetical protein
MKNKKTKEISLPMEFNPMLNKFEPVLPLRKNSLKIERKRNWWAFWYLVIGTIIFALLLIRALI